MRKERILAVVLTVALSIISWSGYAADEPFDTEAAKHTEQGISYLKEKHYDAAITEFEESSSIYPDAESYYYLGYAYYMKGRGGDSTSRKKSMEYFEKAYELDPNFSPTKYKPAEAAPPRAEQQPKQGQAPAMSQPSSTLSPAESTEQQPSSQPSSTAPSAETAAPQQPASPQKHPKP